MKWEFLQTGMEHQSLISAKSVARLYELADLYWRSSLYGSFWSIATYGI